MELNQLEQLAAVGRWGTLSKAAEALHTSQPVLSRTMQKLEDELQVSLFLRRKNRLTLTPAGELAVRCAGQVLEAARQMTDQVRDFDRRQRTIRIGSCAPAPLWDLVPLATRFFPDRTISSEIKPNAALLDGLRESVYDLAVLAEPAEDEALRCQRFCEEHLSLALPQDHPLASRREGVWLREIDGEQMLLYTDIGFWQDFCGKLLPATHFLRQRDPLDFDVLIAASRLPAFTSDLALRHGSRLSNRVNIPLLDPEAHVTYYCACRKADRARLSPLLQAIR